MSKILITGGAGFIGYFLAKRLSEENDNHITVIDNLSRTDFDEELRELFEKSNVDFILGDLTDAKVLNTLVADFDYIYHLSAIIGVKNVLNNPEKVLRVNSISTLNLFEYAKEVKNLKKVFFASTSEVYSGTVRHFSIDIPTSEDVPIAIEDIYSDRSTYAISKIFGESTCLVYGKKYNIPVVIGRFHNVYGPRMGFAHVIPEMFAKMSKDNVIDVLSPNHTRAFCFIDDAVELTIRSSEKSKINNEILHIGNPCEEIKIKDLVVKIAEIMNKEIVVNECNDTPGSPKRRCPDTKKIESLTGYKAKTKLADGIRLAYGWYKDKLNYPEVKIETRT